VAIDLRLDVREDLLPDVHLLTKAAFGRLSP
jgi:hypothetical protein